MKRTGNSGKGGKTVLTFFLCLIFFAGGAGALEIQPGELSLSAAESGQSSGRLFEMRLRFAPDGTQILDSYRIEISYDPKALEFSSGKILSDRFNGSFEMIEDDGLLSVIYLAEESDVMREETDMALLRFRTREPDFSGTTALALTNKLTGETESWSLEFASGAVAGEAVKTTASKASGRTGSSKAGSSRSGTKSSKASEEKGASSSVLMVAGSHRESNVNSGLPAALQTALLAALVVILSALVAVVVKNRKKPQNSSGKGPGNGEKTL